MRIILPLLAPLLPVFLGAVAVSFRQPSAEPVSPAAQPDPRPPGVAPFRNPLHVTPPGENTDPRRMRLTQASRVRIRFGEGEEARYGVIDAVTGSLHLSATGEPHVLELTLGLRGMRGPAGGSLVDRARASLGAHWDASMEFRGTRRAATHSDDVRHSTVSMEGAVRLGGRTRRQRLRWHITPLSSGRLCLVGRSPIVPSEFGVSHSDAKVVVIGNLVFEPAPD